MKIPEFIKTDTEQLEKIIDEYPKQIPIPVVADLMAMDPNNLREAVEDGSLGISWKKPGKVNRGFCIPTGKFVRWWLNMTG